MAISLMKPIYPQFPIRDTTFHPYHVNYWVTGGIIARRTGIRKDWSTLDIEQICIYHIGELQNLNRDDITPIDRWALNFDPSKMRYYENLSNQLHTVSVFLPVLTMLDENIRQDWLDVLLMYLQTQTITNNFYLYSPFGATFQNRLRPVVYYDVC